MIAEYKRLNDGEWGARVRNALEPIEPGHKVRVRTADDRDIPEEVASVVWGRHGDYVVRLKNARKVQPNLDQPPLKASPKLIDEAADYWGVWVKSMVAREGDLIEVETKAGKRWRGYITRIEKSLPHLGVVLAHYKSLDEEGTSVDPSDETD